jgi:glycosyltransferase involved in cell wall biosynthesis
MILHTESSPNFGGQELRIIHEIEGLKNFGIESLLLCKKNSAIELIARKKDIKHLTTTFYSSIDPVSIAKIFTIIKKFDIKLINSHSGYDAWCSVPACYALNIPFIRSRHIGLKLKDKNFTKFIYGRFAKKIIATSKYISDQIQDIGVNKDKIEVVPTGIDPEKFLNPTPFNLRKDYSIPDKNTLLCFASVMKSDKGPHILLKSLPEVLKKINNLTLVLAGNGNFLDKCKKLTEESGLSKNVIYTGHVDNIPGLLNEIDIFILPAIRPEGIPQSLLQAFASRRPVITSDIGGINEAAKHDETAFLVEPRDISHLSGAIIYLLENKEYSQNLAENGYNLFLQKYTLISMLKKMKNIYEEIINK